MRNEELGGGGSQIGPLVKGGWLRRKPQTGGLSSGRLPFPGACADWKIALPTVEKWEMG